MVHRSPKRKMLLRTEFVDSYGFVCLGFLPSTIRIFFYDMFIHVTDSSTENCLGVIPYR